MTPAVAFERSIFSKNHDWNSYNYRVFRVAVNNAPIFRGVDARGGTNLYTNRHRHTHTHTHTHFYIYFFSEVTKEF